MDATLQQILATGGAIVAFVIASGIAIPRVADAVGKLLYVIEERREKERKFERDAHLRLIEQNDQAHRLLDRQEKLLDRAQEMQEAETERRKRIEKQATETAKAHEREIQALRAEVADLAGLPNEVTQLKEQLEARDAKIAALEAEVKDLHGQISTLQTENQKMEQELAQVKESRAAVARERDRLEARLEAVEKAQKPEKDTEDKAA